MARTVTGVLARTIRRIAVAVIGGTVVAIGLAMTVLPGPAIIVIPAGLAILATEFAWARHHLREMKERAGKIAGAAHGSRSRTPEA